MTVDGQIINLRERGLIIGDEEYARSYINDVSYFCLIKACSLGLKIKNGNKHNDFTAFIELPVDSTRS